MDASLLPHADAMPSPEEWRRQRLASVVQRVQRHGAAAQFGAEIELAGQLLQMPAAAQAAESCLLALERGLDLFDLRREVEPIMKRDRAMQEGRSRGGKNKGGKLPAPNRLRDELAQTMASRGLDRGRAVGILAGRYHVTARAVGKALKKAELAQLSSEMGRTVNQLPKHTDAIARIDVCAS